MAVCLSLIIQFNSIQIVLFFLYLHKKLRFSIPAIKGYRLAVSHVFALAGRDLAANSYQLGYSAAVQGIVFLEKSDHQNGTLLFLRALHVCDRSL